MARVAGKNTNPELMVRKAAHSLGYRYRLHRRDLPGSPDLVFPGKKKVIFVHGCFWHRHKACRKATTPRTRRDFWQAKFDANVARDARNVRKLKALGWGVLVLWECAIRDLSYLVDELATFLGPVRD